MKIYFSTSLIILQVVGLLSSCNGLEDQAALSSGFEDQVASSSGLRGLAASCQGSPQIQGVNITDCYPLIQRDCAQIHGCSWTTQHGNKCWGTPMSCDMFDKSSIDCHQQPGCSLSGGGGSAPAPSNRAQGCFSGDTSVQVWKNAEVTTKKMKDLLVGDRVRTGKSTFEPVYAFGHRDAKNHLDYIKISMSEGTIELSKEHLIYANGKAVRADYVKVGDVLSQEDGHPTPVTKISGVQNKKGMYAPLTAGGTILVNGVLASTYVALQSESTSNSEEIKVHGVALPFVNQNMGIHLAISPLRIACTATGYSLGVCKGDNENTEGFNPYVSWGMDMVEWGEKQPVFVQVPVIYGAIVAFLVLNLFEIMVLGSGSLAMRLVVLLAWFTCSALVTLHATSSASKKKIA